MKKRQLKLLILVGILVLCLVGYAVVSAVGEKQDTSSSAAETNITITEFAVSEVALIDWQYEGARYGLLKTDSVWYNQADSSFPIAQNYVSAMSTQIASVTASRKISDVSDFAQYGLEQPQLTVSIMTSTGGELCFVFGAENTVTGEYYMQYSEGSEFAGSSDVYLVPAAVVNAFSYSMDDLVQYESLPNMSEITSVKVEANETYRINYMGDDAAFKWILRNEDNSKRTANTTLCEEFISALSGMELMDCVDFDAVRADLSVYGLDEPWAKVSVDYSVTADSDSAETETFVFLLGNVDEDGNYYLFSEDLMMLYAVDPAVGDFIKSNNIASITDISSLL